MTELKGNKDKLAEGVVIETNMDKQKGISATMIIKDGTLKSGMFVACGKALAPTRIMEDFLGKKINEASFSSPIKIIGFDTLPKVGNKFFTFEDKEEALMYITNFNEPILKKEIFEETEENTGMINVIIKADVTGSIEGILHELEKIKTDRMKVKIVHFGVGDITENDINTLAGKAESLVLGFNVKIDSKARASAEKSGIQIKTFDIIYKLTEWLVEMAEAKTPKINIEEMTGRAKVLKFFSAIKDKNVIGARVEEGEIRVGDEVKIMRKDIEIGRGKIRELQQMKEKTSEVRMGVEFGCQLQSVITPAPGDKFEAYKIIQK
jgi:translation initiation factor IF-2